jgi:small ligand-binding sensory domain FIST
MLDALRAATGIDQWTGASGPGVVAGGRECFDEPALAVMVADLPEGSFSAIGAQVPPDMPFAVVHGDPTSPDLLDRIAEGGRTGYLVGGLMSPDGARAGVPGDAQAALSGYAFSADIAVATGLTQGCSPIGPAHEVTGCDGNLIVELDGKPALDVFKAEVASVSSNAGAAIFAGLIVSGSDSGDYLVRNLLGVDQESGILAVAAELSRGDRLLFCRRDAYAAATDLTRMLDGLAGRIDSEPRGALYFSCLARGPNLFGPDSAELAAIRDVLGPLPMVGFFANGEICHDRLYTHTGVLTLFL